MKSILRFSNFFLPQNFFSPQKDYILNIFFNILAYPGYAIFTTQLLATLLWLKQQ